MNKLEGEYSPDTYHVSHTHSVLLRLQGSKLKMDFPRGMYGGVSGEGRGDGVRKG